MSNTIDWGKIHYSSWSPETNLTGTASTPSFSNTQSIDLDGIDDYVDCGTDASLAVTNISISAWIKTSGGSGYQSIISADSASSTSRRYQLTVNNISGCISFFYWNSSYVLKSINGTTVVNDGKWHHVMAVNNGTNLKIYVDGVLDVSNANGDTMNIAGTTITAIGSIYGSYGFFLGNIDEVSVWNSDQSSIASAIGSSPVDLSSYSPLSWWRFEGTGTTATDSGSGGNNGTLTNGVIRSTDVPT